MHESTCIHGESDHIVKLSLLSLGGALSGAAYMIGGKKFKPVSHILLNELTSAQQAILVNRVNSIVRSVGPEDLIVLTSLLLTNDGIKRQVIEMVGTFVRTELNLALA